MESDIDLYTQGLQVRRLDTSPEPVHHKDIDISKPSILEERPYRSRRSPIIVEFVDIREISVVVMAMMMEVGMNIMKLRMAFTSYNDRVKLMQKCSRAITMCCEKFRVSNFPIATCGSLLTSMIKSGIIMEGKPYPDIFLKEGDSIDLTNDTNFFDKCNASLIFIDHIDLVNHFKVGWEISFADGSFVLTATEKINKKCIRCVVTKSGKLDSLVTVSFRYKGEYMRRDYLTKRDISALEFIKEYKVDMLVVYYARSSETIRKIKKYFPRSGRPQIFGAICTQQGVDSIDNLLQECDGLVLAREYLQWELSKEYTFRMPNIQKVIAAKCQKVGKPLFLSGGILSSIVQTGKLVGNKISDVTNALFDGVTGFMLKKVNKINNAIKAVRTLNEICCAVEPLIFNKSEFWRLSSEIKIPVNNAEAAMMSAAMVANKIEARVIILPTVSGRTAKALLWLRPSALIITVSTNPRTTRFLFTHRNTIPLMYAGESHKSWAKAVHKRLVYGLDFAISRGFLEDGDMYVTLQRSNEGITYCDMVRIFSVTTGGRHHLECPSEYSFDYKNKIEEHGNNKKENETTDSNRETENDTKVKQEKKPNEETQPEMTKAE